jgi:hypothetical protein
MSTVAQTAVHIAKACRAGKCGKPSIDSAALPMMTARGARFENFFPFLAR